MLLAKNQCIESELMTFKQTNVSHLSTEQMEESRDGDQSVNSTEVMRVMLDTSTKVIPEEENESDQSTRRVVSEASLKQHQSLDQILQLV